MSYTKTTHHSIYKTLSANELQKITTTGIDNGKLINIKYKVENGYIFDEKDFDGIPVLEKIVFGKDQYYYWILNGNHRVQAHKEMGKDLKVLIIQNYETYNAEERERIAKENYNKIKDSL